MQKQNHMHTFLQIHRRVFEAVYTQCIDCIGAGSIINSTYFLVFVVVVIIISVVIFFLSRLNRFVFQLKHDIRLFLMHIAFVGNSHDIATQSHQLLTKRRVVKQAKPTVCYIIA